MKKLLEKIAYYPRNTVETIDLDPGKNTYEITGKGEKELCQESKTPGHYYNCLCHKRVK